MKLTLKRIKQLIKEELKNINESEEDSGTTALSADDREEIKKGLFGEYRKNMSKEEREQNNEKAEDMSIRTQKGSNAIEFEYKGTKYYGQI